MFASNLIDSLTRTARVPTPVLFSPPAPAAIAPAPTPVTFDPSRVRFNFGGYSGENGDGTNAQDAVDAFVGVPNAVHAFGDGSTYQVQRTNGDPNYTQWGTFTVAPGGSASQVGDWGALTKRDSPGSNIAQGLALGAALVTGLNATGFLGGGAGAAAGAAGGAAGAGAGTFNAAVDSALVGGSAYAGSVPAAVDLLGAGGLGVVQTGAVGGVLGGAAAVFNPAVDSALVGGPAYAGSVPAAVDLGSAGGIVSTGAAIGASSGIGSAIGGTLDTLTKYAKPVLGAIGALGGAGALGDGHAPAFLGSGSTQGPSSSSSNTFIWVAIIGAAVLVAAVALRK